MAESVPVQTTPLRVPIVIAAASVVRTFGASVSGVLIAERRVERRDSDNAWTRERKREAKRWAREDEMRTFEHRRETYADFDESLKDMARAAYDHGRVLTDETELPWDWQ